MYTSRPIKASRRSEIDPFRAMDVLAEANRMMAAGVNVISLAVGQPSAPIPPHAAEAAEAFLRAGRIGYTDALGRIGLRRRIARHYAETYGVDVPPERIMVTTGSSAGFNLAFLTAFDVGDRVAIANPGYPAYRNILKALGLVPVEIPVGADEDYILTAQRLLEAHRQEPIHGVLIASPANPTGTVTPRSELKALIELCDREGIAFISDEIYHGLSYGERDTSALEFSDRAIIVNSFSKYYCMTGWRIGWLVLPASLVRASERIGQSLYISAPELSQVAAEAVFETRDQLEEIKQTYIRNRAILAQRLPSLGFSDIAPIDGAFYAYARLPAGMGSASEFSSRVLKSCHVALTPGIDFDPVAGEHFVRLSYAGSTSELAEATERLAGFLKA
ncbi:1-aminocyclopropane-1-carboxylate deaminase [Aureimonas ureilytica]|uniref:aspartate transaminase n=1 Tax=Aureimonas ureilytica TaxID=401562 RepID=A0A175R6Z7_9HYPH|nr:aminotransferase class I/II-fold pyridoxal phosphate-dependent enzyme [Aureimonas ureilytica]KTQ88890.1 1-aminocyclopropane-1-carboxylate deaminase [Aureimonas ureilytica]